MIRFPLSALLLCALMLLAPGWASAQIEAPSRLQEVDPGAIEPDLRDESFDPRDMPVEDIPDDPEPPPAEEDEEPARKPAKGAKAVEVTPASAKPPTGRAPFRLRRPRCPSS
ncbi:hypothetical protein ACLESO_53620 [Pyxidicoccus sp. 3LG]